MAWLKLYYACKHKCAHFYLSTTSRTTNITQHKPDPCYLAYSDVMEKNPMMVWMLTHRASPLRPISFHLHRNYINQLKALVSAYKYYHSDMFMERRAI